MDAAAALLRAAVRARGFADYDEFMRVLLCDELKNRDAVLGRTGGAVVRPLPAGAELRGNDDPARQRLRSLYRHGTQAYASLSRLYARLDEFVALQQTLASKAGFVDNLTMELRLAAMNVALASARLGGEGQSLGVISHHMGDASSDVAGVVRVLTSGIQGVSKRLRSVIFNLAAGRLQIEMLLAYVHELLTATAPAEKDRSHHRLIGLLHQAFDRSLERASTALHELEDSTRELNPTSRDLGRHILALHVAQLGGRVETTRVSEQAGFAAVFTDIGGQIDNTRGQLAGLNDALDQLDSLARETPAAARDIAGSVRQMEREIAELGRSEEAAPAAQTVNGPKASLTAGPEATPRSARKPGRTERATILV